MGFVLGGMAILATFLLLRITVDVLSRNVIFILHGVNLRGMCVRLSSGTSSETSESCVVGSGSTCLRWGSSSSNWIAGSGLELLSRSHVMSLGSTGCFNFVLSVVIFTLDLNDEV